MSDASDLFLSGSFLSVPPGPRFYCQRCNWEGTVPACPSCDAEVYKDVTRAAVEKERERVAPLLEAVRDMRRLQKAWFGGDKSRETLNSAKAAEKRVDKLLAELDAPTPVQGDMFR